MNKKVLCILSILCIVLACTVMFIHHEKQTKVVVIEPTPTAQTEEVSTEVNSNETYSGVTQDEAIVIALTDANVKLENTKLVYANEELDDGIVIYDINFISNELEYDYEIIKETGVIKESSCESIYD